MRELKESWEQEFRECFDKTLKPKKPAMGNLDRELCIDFIHKQINQAKRDVFKNIYIEIKEMKNKQFDANIILHSIEATCAVLQAL